MGGKTPSSAFTVAGRSVTIVTVAIRGVQFEIVKKNITAAVTVADKIRKPAGSWVMKNLKF